jgi:hypothetical protein
LQAYIIKKKAYKNFADIYKTLTELKPENAWYFNMLSDAYRNSGDKEKAASVEADLLIGPLFMQ